MAELITVLPYGQSAETMEELDRGVTVMSVKASWGLKWVNSLKRNVGRVDNSNNNESLLSDRSHTKL